MRVSTLLFILYIVIGVGLLLFLGQRVELDTYVTYPVEVSDKGITIKTTLDYSGRAYIYENRNRELFEVNLKNPKAVNGKTLYFTEEKTVDGEKLFIDIPNGMDSLLNRVFIKAGKADD